MFRRHGKAWYLLPVFLLVIGGIIAYAVLRNSDPELARRTLLLGIILFAVFAAAAVALSSPLQDSTDSVDGAWNDADTASENGNAGAEPARPLPIAEIKERSISVPYEMLVKYSDAYVGDIIQYKGHVIGVLDDQDGGSESYVLKVEAYATDDRPFAQDRLIWSEYTPKTDEERALVKSIAANSGLFEMADSKNAVNIWATMNGLRDFEVIFKTNEIPETEVMILELIADGGTSSRSDAPAAAIYTVSYDPIPDYVNATAVTAAMNGAMEAWAAENPSIVFEKVESDASLNISWKKFMPPNILGSYRQYNITNGGGPGGITTVHEIHILLGKDDCNGEYRQFSYDSMRYTIAHELGHYLGLRHISDPDSLMHTGGYAHADNIFMYKNLGYSIPKLDRGVHTFMATEDIESSMKRADAKMTALMAERTALRAVAADEQALAANKKAINDLTQHMSALKEEAACMDGPSDFWQELASLS